jgi:hypothetical protein
MRPVAASRWKLNSFCQTKAVQIAGAVVGENILVQVFEELVEDVVEHQKVDAIW